MSGRRLTLRLLTGTIMGNTVWITACEPTKPIFEQQKPISPTLPTPPEAYLRSRIPDFTS